MKNRYFDRVGTGIGGSSRMHRIAKIGSASPSGSCHAVTIRRHIKVRCDANPYDAVGRVLRGTHPSFQTDRVRPEGVRKA